MNPEPNALALAPDEEAEYRAFYLYDDACLRPDLPRDRERNLVVRLLATLDAERAALGNPPVNDPAHPGASQGSLTPGARP